MDDSTMVVTWVKGSSLVAAEGGLVVFRVADGHLTPKDARELAKGLTEAAEEALAQRSEEEQ